MLRKGYAFYAFVILLALFVMPGQSVQAAGPPQPTTESVPGVSTPRLTLPNDTTIHLCDTLSYCFEVKGGEEDSSSSSLSGLFSGPYILTLISGPITMPPDTMSSEYFTKQICFSVDSSGDYEFIFALEGEHGRQVFDTVLFTVITGNPPVLLDQQFAFEQCNLREDRLLELSYTDPDGSYRFSLLSGQGSIDSLTGTISYRPDTSGLFLFEVEVRNDCGSDSAIISDDAILNMPPYTDAKDTTVNLCGVQEICFDIIGHDPEGDSLTMVLLEGIGNFTQLDDSTGRTCFIPENIDSAVYRFVFRTVDSCILSAGPGGLTSSTIPASCLDTVLVTVIIDNPPVLACPDSLQFFGCDPDSFSFDITADNEVYDSTIFSVISGNASINNGRVTFFADSAGFYDLTIVAEDDCGADTCTVPVEVVYNTPPFVSTADDFDIFICEPQPVCFIATFNDFDQNLDSVLINYGWYDSRTGQICFDADTSGIYEIIVTATDTCGAATIDTTIVTVDVNQLPQVSLGGDSSLVLCQVEEICVDALFLDDNTKNLYVSFGQYDSLLNKICFTPDSSGIYTIIMQATDYCDKIAADTVTISVVLNEAPVIAGFNDTSLYLCYPQEICLTPDFYDPNNDIANVSLTEGYSFDSLGQICFEAYTEGVHEIVLSVTDSCGVTVTDTAVVTIKTDQSIAIVFPNDTTIELCQPDTLSFPVGGIPVDAQVAVGGTNVWWNDSTQSVEFYSDCCLENIITVDVTTACGTYSGTFTVNVKTNSAPLVILPQDTTMLLCDSATISLPVGISDADSNLSQVTVVGGVYDDFNNVVRFKADSAGTYVIAITATDSCGAVDSDEIVITIGINSSPTLSMTPPEFGLYCALPDSIFIPLNYLDPDSNIATVSTSLGIIENDTVRFSPSSFGDYQLIVAVSDSCGLGVEDTVVISLLQDSSFVNINCPTNLSRVLCGPDSVFFEIDSQFVDGQDYTVTVAEPFASYDNGVLSFFADSSGLYDITFIGTSSCNSDTCSTTIFVDITDPLVIENVPVDTIAFLCAPDTLIYPLVVTGSGGPNGSIYALAPAFVSADTLYVPVLTEGLIDVTLIAESGLCGSDTSRFTIDASFNTAPTLQTTDTSLTLCTLVEICVPFTVYDFDGNLKDVLSSVGTVTMSGDKKPGGSGSTAQIIGDKATPPSGVEGTVCFTPGDFGDHEIILTAVDSCGAEYVDTILVSISQGAFVDLIDPVEQFAPVEQCSPTDSLCLPLEVVGQPDSIVVSGAVYDSVTSLVCFLTDTSGFYSFEVIAYAECNVDTTYLEIDVKVLEPVQVVCAAPDTSAFICSSQIFDTLSYPVAITGDYDSVYVVSDSAEAFWQNGMINIVLNGQVPSQVNATVYASNSCGIDSCTISVGITLNSPPVLTLQSDTTIVGCTLSDVCVKFTLFDIDNNLVEVRTTLGLINDSIICFTPDSLGVYEMIVTATDSCGLSDTDTLTIDIKKGSVAIIDCPPVPNSAVVDLPDTVRIPISISPAGTNVTVAPFGYYDSIAGELVAFVSQTGSYNFTIIADADCNSDTCSVQVDVNQYQPPLVICEGVVDTALCLLDTQTICLPVTVAGSFVQVDVTLGGTYDSSGFVCIPVDTGGTYRVRIIASDSLQADTCYTSLTVSRGLPPVVKLPPDYSVSLCQPDSICLPALVYDSTNDLISVVSNFGIYDSLSGSLCFAADTAGTYTLILTAVDSCSSVVADTTIVVVGMNGIPVVEILPIDSLLCQSVEVCIPVTINDDNLVTVSTNIGSYDSTTGEVCVLSSLLDSLPLIVEVTDSCDIIVADTAVFNLSYNSAPTIAGLNDTTIYLCYPQDICITPIVADIDNNLVSITTNRGPLDSSGSICIVAYSNGDYEVIVTATDSCGAEIVDTAIVTVLTDQTVQIVFPKDTSIFLCEPDTVCFPISGIPAGAQVAVGGTNVWYDEATQTVCFFSDCCLENIITIDVTTPCGTYSGQFTVNVRTNSKPLVILPQDTAIVQCQFEKISLPVGISDADNNLATVTVTGGVYDDFNNLITFTPDSSGDYLLTVVAVDSCNKSDTDQVLVSVKLNQAPTITYDSLNTTDTLCSLKEICLPISIDDADTNIVNITVIGGISDSRRGVVCFVPTQYGQNSISVIATDECGLRDSVEIVFDVVQGDFVSIQCPADTMTAEILCSSGAVAVSVPILGNNFTLAASFGTWANDTLSFNADTSGLYEIRLVADAFCNSDSCTIKIPVQILDSAYVSCPGDATEFLCGPDTLYYPFTISNSIDSVQLIGPAFIVGDSIGVPLLTAGSAFIQLVGSGPCGEDTCTFTVTAVTNSAPVVNLGRDTVITSCTLSEICLPISIRDANNNIDSIIVPQGVVVSDSQLCFTPPAFSNYELIVSVTDSCGATSIDTLRLNVLLADSASIFCPDDVQFASICGPSEICIVAPVSPSDAKVTVLPAGTYNSANGTICVFADTSGTYNITVIAESQCSVDTCNFTLEVNMAERPGLTMPQTVDTVLCTAQLDTICIPVQVVGTGVQVTVSPIGYYSAGFVCVPITQAGTTVITVAANGLCGDTTGTITLNVQADQSPALILPATVTIERCPNDTDLVCIDGIFANDLESSSSIAKTCGPGTFTKITPDSGEVCFLPSGFGSFEFCFEATDGCSATSGSFFVDVVQRADCDVCLRATIGKGECTPVGLRQSVPVNIATNDQIGGFDLLISYDASALNFQNATITGSTIELWEYFTWNIGGGSCGNACPSGVIRFVAIADQNDGNTPPINIDLSPDGPLFFMEFLIANDQNLGGQFVPIQFVWYDCADNSFSDPSGTNLYVENRIYNPSGILLWDEDDDINFPDLARPFGMGVHDSCLTGGKDAPIRCIEFTNGGLCIIHPDSIDARGDINLNNVAYEISDVVVFTNYFIKGLAAFTINVAGQIAATDVNADGLTLTVSDLSFLIRVVIGDADPIPKVVPYDKAATLQAVMGDGIISVTTETVSSIGAAYVVFDVDPSLGIGQPQLSEAAQNMNFIWSEDGNQLKMLLFDIGTNRVEAGKNVLFEIPYSGVGDIVITHTELVDYNGKPYQTIAQKTSVPSSFSLEQNYPNPFNPTTTISFGLSVHSEWQLSIYNVNGIVVRSFSGASEAGRESIFWDGRNGSGVSVASGIYLYRLEAGGFTESKKMILLK